MKIKINSLKDEILIKIMQLTDCFTNRLKKIKKLNLQTKRFKKTNLNGKNFGPKKNSLYVKRK